MTEGKKAEYKNAIRSRQLIINAYVALLNEKDVNKITVTDIIGRAGISRGTFYAHYSDVHDLYNKLGNDAINLIMMVIDETGILNFIENPFPTFEKSMSFLDKNKSYYCLLLSSCVGSDFLQKLDNEFADKFVPQLMEHFSNAEKETVRSYISFTASGIRGMIFRWLEGTLDLTPAECARLLSDMLTGACPKDLKV